MTGRCGACGYFAETHGIDGRCHPATADRNGRRGSWRPAPEPVPDVGWREIMSLEAAARRVESDAGRAAYEPPAPTPPQVPARRPAGPGEIAGAGTRKQATKLGRVAIDAGWIVEAVYWRAYDGTEGCALRLAGPGGVRAVATWARKPGNLGALTGWSADIAYAWRPGDMPAKVNHSQLDELLETC